MAPRDAVARRLAVSGIRPNLLVAGALCVAFGVAIALVMENGVLRYAGSLTAIAIGLGLFRRAFRVE
jgi:hypothetical protein